jgi:hypothetical protein
MPGLILRLRSRSLAPLGGAAMLLAFAALATVGLENVSFGHGHVAGEHAAHHHHFYLGSHEHPDAQPGHDHQAPAPEDRDAPRRTATVSAAPTLFQPVGASVLAVSLADSTPVFLALALPLVVRDVVQLTPPRAPPPPSQLPTP